MKKTVAFKLFIGSILFALTIIMIVWVLNTRYLGEYYLDRKKEAIVESARQIQTEYTGDIDSIFYKLEKIENEINGGITIISEGRDIKYATYNDRQGFGMGKGMMRGASGLQQISRNDIQRVLNGEIVFNIYKHPRLDTRVLMLLAPVADSDILVIESSAASIEESVNIAKDFYVYIGMISLIIAAIIALLGSRVISKPIVELNKVAQMMSRLDFSSKYNVKSNDEIGELGKSINFLSEKLDKTISELNQANEKLVRDIEKERSLEKMRKEFVSNVSHELKTPISLIQGYAEGLKDNIAGDESSRNFYCEVIMDESQKMEKLVKDLLQLSQLESGKYFIEKTTFNICEVVERVIEKYQPIIRKKNIKIILNKEQEEILVSADKTRIDQVLVNLINNGINHVSNQGMIDISIKYDSDLARVSVHNTGNNIPNEEIDRIWESFYKIDKSRARKYGGTGLGLSIVGRILQLHNAEYGVANTEDGVEFWFKLQTALN